MYAATDVIETGDNLISEFADVSVVGCWDSVRCWPNVVQIRGGLNLLDVDDVAYF